MASSKDRLIPPVAKDRDYQQSFRANKTCRRSEISGHEAEFAATAKLDEIWLANEKVRKPPHAQSLRERVGVMSMSMLVVSVILELAFAGFIAFLWFGGIQNTTWHRIMVYGWLTQAITLSSLSLRTVVGFQAGTATAMLAALLLESFSVLLVDAARVSTMRARSVSPLDLLWTTFHGFMLSPAGRRNIYTLLVFLLATTTTLLQFTSTILLSDLHLGSLAGLPKLSSRKYDISYESLRYGLVTYDGRADVLVSAGTASIWERSSVTFSAFAEYAEPAVTREDIDDTGVLLRAFLPYSDATARQTLQTYHGDAIIFDARVSCQSPHFSNLTVQIQEYDDGSDVSLVFWNLVGSFKPRLVSRLLPRTDSVPFNCSVVSYVWDGFDSLSICQLQISSSGGPEDWPSYLVSEFVDWADATGRSPINGVYAPPFMLVSSPVWKSGDMKHAEISLNDVVLSWTGSWTNITSPPTSFEVSVTVCYPAYGFTRLGVNMFASANRTEPVVQWDMSRGLYTVPSAHEQMGEQRIEASTRSLDERGVLALSRKSSWLRRSEDRDANNFEAGTRALYFQSQIDIGPGLIDFVANATAIFNFNSTTRKATSLGLLPGDTNVSPDIAVANLFIDSLFYTNFSAARALSTLFTVSASMSYYEQMPMFGEVTNATEVFDTTVLYPQSYVGLTIIMCVLVCHVLIVTGISALFIKRSKYTLLGNDWAAVSQLATGSTEGMLKASRMMSDEEVKKQLRLSGRDTNVVGVCGIGDSGVGLRVRRNGSTKECDEYPFNLDQY